MSDRASADRARQSDEFVWPLPLPLPLPRRRPAVCLLLVESLLCVAVCSTRTGSECKRRELGAV